MTVLASGPACPEGGVTITAADGTTANVCNGARGPSASEVTATALPVGDSTCPTGGAQLNVGNTTIPVCNGAAGPQGAPGANGMDGMNGMNGADGMNGTNGADGMNGTNGTNGTNGADGASVTITTLSVGDANCVFGGTRFNVGTSTGYACNGAPPQLATGWTFDLLVGTTFYGSFDQGSLGVDVGLDQTTIPGPGGAQIPAPLVGQVTLRPVVLEGRITPNREAWLWREAVRTNGANQVRTATIRLSLSGTSTPVATFALDNAWPTALELASGDGLRGRPPRFRLTLVGNNFTRVVGPGAATPLPSGVTAWLLRPTTALFTGVEGVQSANGVGPSSSPGGAQLPRLTLSRPLDRDSTAWTWFNQVLQGDLGAARKNVTLSTGGTMDIAVTNALPFNYVVTLGADGQPMESILISGEGAHRIP